MRARAVRLALAVALTPGMGTPAVFALGHETLRPTATDGVASWRLAKDQLRRALLLSPDHKLSDAVFAKTGEMWVDRRAVEQNPGLLLELEDYLKQQAERLGLDPNNAEDLARAAQAVGIKLRWYDSKVSNGGEARQSLQQASQRLHAFTQRAFEGQDGERILRLDPTWFGGRVAYADGVVEELPDETAVVSVRSRAPETESGGESVSRQPAEALSAEAREIFEAYDAGGLEEEFARRAIEGLGYDFEEARQTFLRLRPPMVRPATDVRGLAEGDFTPWLQNPFLTKMQARMQRAAEAESVPDAITQRLLETQQIHEGELQAQLGGESWTVFFVRSQDNDWFGPYQGGIRLLDANLDAWGADLTARLKELARREHSPPELEALVRDAKRWMVEEARALSKGMTFKFGSVNLDGSALASYGGGKGTVALLGYQRDAGGRLTKVKAWTLKELKTPEGQAFLKAIFTGMGAGWTRRGVVGPTVDRPAPDVNTGEREMIWLTEGRLQELANHYGLPLRPTETEYTEEITLNRSPDPVWVGSLPYTRAAIREGLTLVREGQRIPDWFVEVGTFAAKPTEFGGLSLRTEATGLGGVYAIERMLEIAPLQTSPTLAINGAGNAALYAGLLGTARGWRIRAINDTGGALVVEKEGGLSSEEFQRVKGLKEHKQSVVDAVTGIPGTRAENGKSHGAEAVVGADVDLLILAGLEDTVTLENVDRIKAKIVVELANGAITEEADRRLFERGIIVIHDSLASAGGTLVSSAERERVQDILRTMPDPDVSAEENQRRAQQRHALEQDIRDDVKRLIQGGLDAIWQEAQRHHLSLRDAGDRLVVRRLTQAHLAGGEQPAPRPHTYAALSEATRAQIEAVIAEVLPNFTANVPDRIRRAYQPGYAEERLRNILAHVYHETQRPKKENAWLRELDHLGITDRNVVQALGEKVFDIAIANRQTLAQAVGGGRFVSAHVSPDPADLDGYAYDVSVLVGRRPLGRRRLSMPTRIVGLRDDGTVVPESMTLHDAYHDYRWNLRLQDATWVVDADLLPLLEQARPLQAAAAVAPVASDAQDLVALVTAAQRGEPGAVEALRRRAAADPVAFWGEIDARGFDVAVTVQTLIGGQSQPREGSLTARIRDEITRRLTQRPWEPITKTTLAQELGVSHVTVINVLSGDSALQRMYDRAHRPRAVARYLNAMDAVAARQPAVPITIEALAQELGVNVGSVRIAFHRYPWLQKAFWDAQPAQPPRGVETGSTASGAPDLSAHFSGLEGGSLPPQQMGGADQIVILEQRVEELAGELEQKLSEERLPVVVFMGGSPVHVFDPANQRQDGQPRDPVEQQQSIHVSVPYFSIQIAPPNDRSAIAVPLISLTRSNEPINVGSTSVPNTMDPTLMRILDTLARRLSVIPVLSRIAPPETGVNVQPLADGAAPLSRKATSATDASTTKGNALNSGDLRPVPPGAKTVGEALRMLFGPEGDLTRVQPLWQSAGASEPAITTLDRAVQDGDQVGFSWSVSGGSGEASAPSSGAPTGVVFETTVDVGMSIEEALLRFAPERPVEGLRFVNDRIEVLPGYTLMVRRNGEASVEPVTTADELQRADTLLLMRTMSGGAPKDLMIPVTRQMTVQQTLEERVGAGTITYVPADRVFEVRVAGQPVRRLSVGLFTGAGLVLPQPDDMVGPGDRLVLLPSLSGGAPEDAGSTAEGQAWELALIEAALRAQVPAERLGEVEAAAQLVSPTRPEGEPAAMGWLGLDGNERWGVGFDDQVVQAYATLLMAAIGDWSEGTRTAITDALIEDEKLRRLIRDILGESRPPLSSHEASLVAQLLIDQTRQDQFGGWLRGLRDEAQRQRAQAVFDTLPFTNPMRVLYEMGIQHGHSRATQLAFLYHQTFSPGVLVNERLAFLPVGMLRILIERGQPLNALEVAQWSRADAVSSSRRYPTSLAMLKRVGLVGSYGPPGAEVFFLTLPPRRLTEGIPHIEALLVVVDVLSVTTDEAVVQHVAEEIEALFTNRVRLGRLHCQVGSAEPVVLWGRTRREALETHPYLRDHPEIIPLDAQALDEPLEPAAEPALVVVGPRAPREPGRGGEDAVAIQRQLEGFRQGDEAQTRQLVAALRANHDEVLAQLKALGATPWEIESLQAAAAPDGPWTRVLVGPGSTGSALPMSAGAQADFHLSWARDAMVRGFIGVALQEVHQALAMTPTSGEALEVLRTLLVNIMERAAATAEQDANTAEDGTRAKGLRNATQILLEAATKLRSGRASLPRNVRLLQTLVKKNDLALNYLALIPGMSVSFPGLGGGAPAAGAEDVATSASPITWNDVYHIIDQLPNTVVEIRPTGNPGQDIYRYSVTEPYTDASGMVIGGVLSRVHTILEIPRNMPPDRFVRDVLLNERINEDFRLKMMRKPLLDLVKRKAPNLLAFVRVSRRWTPAMERKLLEVLTPLYTGEETDSFAMIETVSDAINRELLGLDEETYKKEYATSFIFILGSIYIGRPPPEQAVDRFKKELAQIEMGEEPLPVTADLDIAAPVSIRQALQDPAFQHFVTAMKERLRVKRSFQVLVQRKGTGPFTPVKLHETVKPRDIIAVVKRTGRGQPGKGPGLGGEDVEAVQHQLEGFRQGDEAQTRQLVAALRANRDEVLAQLKALDATADEIAALLAGIDQPAQPPSDLDQVMANVEEKLLEAVQREDVSLETLIAFRRITTLEQADVDDIDLGKRMTQFQLTLIQVLMGVFGHAVPARIAGVEGRVFLDTVLARIEEQLRQRGARPDSEVSPSKGEVIAYVDVSSQANGVLLPPRVPEPLFISAPLQGLDSKTQAHLDNLLGAIPLDPSHGVEGQYMLIGPVDRPVALAKITTRSDPGVAGGFIKTIEYLIIEPHGMSHLSQDGFFLADLRDLLRAYFEDQPVRFIPFQQHFISAVHVQRLLEEEKVQVTLIPASFSDGAEVNPSEWRADANHPDRIRLKANPSVVARRNAQGTYDVEGGGEPAPPPSGGAPKDLMIPVTRQMTVQQTLEERVGAGTITYVPADRVFEVRVAGQPVRRLSVGLFTGAGLVLPQPDDMVGPGDRLVLLPSLSGGAAEVPPGYRGRPGAQWAGEARGGAALDILAQRVTAKAGAETGQVHIDTAIAAGATGIIAGHSETRPGSPTPINDTDEQIHAQVQAAVEREKVRTIILAIGETEEPPELTAAQVPAVLLAEQLRAALVDLTAAQLQGRLIVAYEPRWAIAGSGTGRPANPEYAQAAHRAIREALAKQFDETFAKQVRIIYGGSANAKNAAEFLRQDDIDGLLIGGASKSTADFLPILQAAQTLAPDKNARTGRVLYIGGNQKTYAVTESPSDFVAALGVIDPAFVEVGIAPQAPLMSAWAQAIAQAARVQPLEREESLPASASLMAPITPTDSEPERLVYFAGEGQAEGVERITDPAVRKALLGGKGAGMQEMMALGIPVPPGFTITTKAGIAYLQSGQDPHGLEEEVAANLRRLEEATGKRFGDSANPLLVAVRSGAPVTMPGMMDTVLNLGLNDETMEGLAKATGNRRFALDSYRRFIELYGSVVLGVPREDFDAIVTVVRIGRGLSETADLTEEALEDTIGGFKVLVQERTGREFPADVHEQLWETIRAVFRSWNSERAKVYREDARRSGEDIPEEMGTAVDVVAMVFGNLGPDSGTGIYFTRSSSTGEPEPEGDFLVNAQGEDVVSGRFMTQPISALQDTMPEVYQQLLDVGRKLERLHGTMMDTEFTIENGRLYMLQQRTGKSTGPAAIRIAVDMANEGLITKADALRRVKPEDLTQTVSSRVDPKASVTVLTSGVAASFGAETGRVVFTPEEAVEWAARGERVILVRRETSPEDIAGMLASIGILTARGGATSHAMVVAKSKRKTAIAGALAVKINEAEGWFKVGETMVHRGDVITLDANTNRVLLGSVPTVLGQMAPELERLLQWADETATLGVRVNADTGEEAQRGRSYGAKGIGLVRTEHMFFGERLPAMRRMILAKETAERQAALDELVVFQQRDFEEIFQAMDGLPVTIRFLDPPLHEFLPKRLDLELEIQRLRLEHGDAQQLHEKESLLEVVKTLEEFNPMLGLRGARLGILYPEITRMQARAILRAAVAVSRQGVRAIPEIMIPLIFSKEELDHQKAIVEEVVQELGVSRDEIPYTIGTMIEIPGGALDADRIAQSAEFFSVGSNDLTQMGLGISRDDAQKAFLNAYLQSGLLEDDPFTTLHPRVVELIMTAVEKGRRTRPGLKVGICGEHAGDPKSVIALHQVGLDYVSPSGVGVLVARLVAAHAQLSHPRPPRGGVPAPRSTDDSSAARQAGATASASVALGYVGTREGAQRLSGGRLVVAAVGDQPGTDSLFVALEALAAGEQWQPPSGVKLERIAGHPVIMPEEPADVTAVEKFLHRYQKTMASG